MTLVVGAWLAPPSLRLNSKEVKDAAIAKAALEGLGALGLGVESASAVSAGWSDTIVN